MEEIGKDLDALLEEGILYIIDKHIFNMCRRIM